MSVAHPEPAGSEKGAAAAPFSLEGRVALVTGALGLLGRQHCQALALAGAQVVVVDLDGGGCAALARELTARHGRPALGYAADIVEPSALRALLAAVLARFGRFDVLVNNAAVNDAVEQPLAGGEASRFEHYPLELWRRVLDVNVTRTFLCCQMLGSELARRGGSSIINIASTYAVVAPDQSLYRCPDGQQSFFKSAAYPASKGAVLALTRFLAAYWGPAGVRVNALSPGGVENQQPPHFVAEYARRTPLGRMAQPDDYGGALVFLASEASRYMTGANLIVDGGWTVW
ncbi:MAG: SDR family oxidoreductase [Proteobacteria bacterium]|nr:SDR family oxidoreductase [Pseudomonadota bacterium]